MKYILASSILVVICTLGYAEAQELNSTYQCDEDLSRIEEKLCLNPEEVKNIETMFLEIARGFSGPITMSVHHWKEKEGKYHTRLLFTVRFKGMKDLYAVGIGEDHSQIESFARAFKSAQESVEFLLETEQEENVRV